MLRRPDALTLIALVALGCGRIGFDRGDGATDSDPPSIDYLRIEAVSPTRTNLVPVDLGASDPTSVVSAFCLGWAVGEDPTIDDACWTPVDAPSPGLAPAPTLMLDDFPFRLGFGAATYRVRAWVRDAAGNTSEPSDVVTIEYLPGVPPTVTDVIAAANTTPDDPPSVSDLSAPPGTPVYVKWAARDDDPLPVEPISLYYTTDDLTYTEIATGLLNAENGACTVDEPGTTTDDGATGCFVWTSGPPVTGYLRIRVVAEDSLSQRTAATSPPLNTPEFRFLVGNTDPGTGASARAALFFGGVHPTSQSPPGPGNMLLTPDGRFFFRDVRRGILVVDPSDGIQRVFVPTTGESTGDGGPAANATLRLPLRMALRGADEIVIFDYDRIRRIALDEPGMPIDTIVGGGAETADVVAPLELSIEPVGGYTDEAATGMAFFALPNGDIWFRSEEYIPVAGSPPRIRIFRAETSMVESIRLSGPAVGIDPSIALEDCIVRQFAIRYDLVTSEVTHAQISVRSSPDLSSCTTPTDRAAIIRIDPETGTPAATHPEAFETNWTWHVFLYPVHGQDGELYFVSRNGSEIFGYDRAADGFELLAGTGLRGRCPDGTPALECEIDPVDLFVDQQGRLWILDFERIRVIDENGDMLTVLGQPLDFGDGGRPESARFAEVTGIRRWSDATGDHLVLLDKDMVRIRELEPGQTMRTVAGTGTNRPPDTSTPASSQGILVFTSGTSWPDFQVEPDGALWLNRGRGYVARLDRVGDVWSNLVGGGSTPYYSPAAAASTGDEVDLDPDGFTAYPPQVIGRTGTSLLVHTNIYDQATRTHVQSRLLEISKSDGATSVVMGTDGPIETGLCPDGTRLDACPLPLSSRSLPVVRDEVGNRWLFAIESQRDIRTLATSTIGTLTTLDEDVLGFDFQRTGPADAGTLYACGRSGELHVVDVATGADRRVALPSPTMGCTGPVEYVDTPPSVLFAFEQNGSAGVAEYLPP